MKAARGLSVIRALLIILFALSVLAGCGYGLKRESAVHSVKLGSIINETTEPGLSDILYDALSHSLMKYGIDIDRGSSYTLKGRLEEVELRSSAEKEGLTTQYDVRVRGRFILLGPEGASRPLRESGVFIVTFSSKGPLQEVTALKEQALGEALSDMADEVVASIMESR